MDAAVPAVEVADDRDRARVRRPHGERHALDAVHVARMRSQSLVEVLVPSLAREMEVQLPQGREERVRIADRDGLSLGVGDLELVPERQRRAGHASREDSRGVNAPQAHRLPAAGQDRDAIGSRPVRPHDDAAPRGVGAEQPVRVVVVASDELLDLLRDGHVIRAAGS